jgi:rhodanese-related sulfurtransferase
MGQNITLTAEALVKQAKAEITEYTVDDVKAKAGDDNVVLVDIRDPRELTREGRVPGAFHCPRGMLEFWISPESPYHKDVFAQDKEYVFFCAGGMRSALAAKQAQDMGLKPVAHMIGGFGAWKKGGGEIEPSDAPMASKA